MILEEGDTLTNTALFSGLLQSPLACLHPGSLSRQTEWRRANELASLYRRQGYYVWLNARACKLLNNGLSWNNSSITTLSGVP